MERKVRARARVSLTLAENEIEEDRQVGGDARDPFNIGIEEDLIGNIVYTHLNNLVVGGSKGEEHLSRRVKIKLTVFIYNEELCSGLQRGTHWKAVSLLTQTVLMLIILINIILALLET